MVYGYPFGLLFIVYGYPFGLLFMVYGYPFGLLLGVAINQKYKRVAINHK
jgi:hypothetical protein